MKNYLTICSCYYSPESRRLLELNFEFIRRENPEFSFLGLVANNTRVPFLGSDAPFGENIQIIEGAGWPVHQRKWVRGSYHHAAALEKLVPLVTTRFVLFLDTDFYIVRKNWIKEIPEYMTQNNISFFGVPWHPQHVKKIRYFPAPHSLFIDLEKINKSTVMFQPDYDFERVPSFRERIIKKIMRIILGRRGEIGIAKDTGYPLYKRYGRDQNINSECMSPVWDYEPTLLDILLPDRFSYIPKKTGFIAKKSFQDFGVFDPTHEGWESFLWKGAPFGFHVRGSKKMGDDLNKFKILTEALKNF